MIPRTVGTMEQQRCARGAVSAVSAWQRAFAPCKLAALCRPSRGRCWRPASRVLARAASYYGRPRQARQGLASHRTTCLCALGARCIGPRHLAAYTAVKRQAPPAPLTLSRSYAPVHRWPCRARAHCTRERSSAPVQRGRPPPARPPRPRPRPRPPPTAPELVLLVHGPRRARQRPCAP